MSEKPLNEYIDLEAYDVVTGEQHRKLQARVASLEEALREIKDTPASADDDGLIAAAIARIALAHEEEAK